MTHNHESPPLPWSDQVLRMIAPGIPDISPIVATVDDRGKIIALGNVEHQNLLHDTTLACLLNEPDRLRDVAAVVFVADAARNTETLPVKPNPGDLVMLARDGDSRAVDTISVVFVQLLETRQVVIDYRYDNGKRVFADPVEVNPIGSHITDSVLKAWSQAIEQVMS